LEPGSIRNWSDLEKKFHTYFFTGTGEKKITDLMAMRQRSNESGLEFLQRYRDTKNLCFSVNLPDD
jgi:DNA-binding GntR family transcriptional regulator